MTHAFDRRLTRLEEWIARYGTGVEERGKGHYEMLSFAPGAYVRVQRWVAEQ